MWLLSPRAALLLSALSALSLALALPVSAQDAPAATTWYVHGMTGPDGAGGYIDFLPPTSDDADQTATNTAGMGGDPHVTHVEAKDPLAGAMALGAGEPVAKVWVKSWNNGPAPGTLVTVSITADGTEIATGSVSHDVLNGAIVEYVIPLTMAVESLPAGAAIAMDVILEAEACGCYNAFAYPRGTSPDHPWQFTLPLVASAGAGGVAEGIVEAIAKAIEDDAVDLDLRFSEPSTGLQEFQWATALTEVALAAEVEATAGAASIAVRDGAGKVVFDSAGEPGSHAVNATGAPGNWSITVTTDNFTGAVALKIDAAAPKATVAASPQTTTAPIAPASVTNETARPGGGFPLRYVEKGASAGLLAPLALLVACALVARRRLR